MSFINDLRKISSENENKYKLSAELKATLTKAANNGEYSVFTKVETLKEVSILEEDGFYVEKVNGYSSNFYIISWDGDINE